MMGASETGKVKEVPPCRDRLTSCRSAPLAVVVYRSAWSIWAARWCANIATGASRPAEPRPSRAAPRPTCCAVPTSCLRVVGDLQRQPPGRLKRDSRQRADAAHCLASAPADTSAHAQSLQIVPEAGIGLARASGIVDHHARNLQPHQRQAHGHAMVVVRVDRRAVRALPGVIRSPSARSSTVAPSFAVRWPGRRCDRFLCGECAPRCGCSWGPRQTAPRRPAFARCR